MKHYTKEELDCYRHHEMSVLGRIQCTAHLKLCKECAKLLEELKRDDSFIAELQDSVKVYASAAALSPLLNNNKFHKTTKVN